MSETIKTITETYIVPDNCRQRFLLLNITAAAQLSEHGIFLAGISDLVPPYAMGRENPHSYLAIFTIDGTASYQVGRQTGTFSPGTLWLAPPEIPHQYVAGASWRALWFHFSKDSISFTADEFPIVRRSHNIDSLLMSVEGYLRESIVDDPNGMRAASAYAELIVTYLDRGLHVPSARDQQSLRRLNRLWDLIYQDLQKDWQVAEMAGVLNISEPHLYRMVKEYYRISPMHMVTSLRMKHADELLHRTDYKLSRIARLVGYNSPFSLSRAFKRYFGESPQFVREKFSDFFEMDDPRSGAEPA